MATSTEQLNDAITALQGAADAYNGKKGEIDAALATSQAGYAALSANLKGVVNSQMDFTATIDPDEPAPTNVDGGKFNTIEAAVAAAPLGSRITLSLVNDTTFALAADVDVGNRTLRLRPVSYVDPKPTVQFTTYATATHNRVRGFRVDGGGIVDMSYVNAALPTAKFDAGLPWSSSNGSAVLATVAGFVRFRFAYGTVVGGESRSLVSANGGQSVAMALYFATLDGAINAVADAGDGVVTLAKGAITLQNGAALTAGGTLGTNLLQN